MLDDWYRFDLVYWYDVFDVAAYTVSFLMVKGFQVRLMC